MKNISDSNIVEVIVEKIPLDLECQLDLQTGQGIRITSVESFNKKNEKIYNGLQSEFFGSDYADSEEAKKLFKCKCGYYTGKAYRGKFCEKCQSYVEYNPIDLTRFGWIILDHFKVLSPIYYAKLADALGMYEGEKVLDKIITVEYYDEEEGPDFTDKELESLKKHPFLKKGMQWLRENIMEVLDFYEKKKPGKNKLFKELKSELHLMWTSCIPVYSAVLRVEAPNGEKGSKSYKLKSNTQYKAIIKLVNAINKVEPDEFNFDALNTIDINLAAIQKELGKLFDGTYTDLTGKNGIINGKVISGRYNFSARNIIVPNSGRLRSDEVELGYIPFLELFRYEIQNLYRKLKGCTPMEASSVWKKACNHFDPTIYSIMEHMVNDPETQKNLTLIINRNPSINYGSFITCRVVKVHAELSNKTLCISSHSIIPMNADFDGDILNVFRVISKDFAKRFDKNMNPRYNLNISRMTGKCNPETMPIKDEIVAFWAFCNL